MKRTLAAANRDRLQKVYAQWNGVDAHKHDSKTAGHRALKNLALDFLSAIGDKPAMDLVVSQYKEAKNMTDQITALAILADSTDSRRGDSLKAFHLEFKADAVVLNKWFAVQAAATMPGTLDGVKALTKHPDFALTNPNNVYSLLRTFGNNLTVFHDPQNPGYAFYADQILAIDALNPQVAARLCAVFNVVSKLPAALKALARQEVQRVLAHPKLSKNTRELLEPVLKEI